MDTGTILEYILLSSPENGSLSIDGSLANYIPNQDFNGTDSFEYQVWDGELTSESAIVEINVESVNDTPIIVSVASTEAVEDEEYIYQVEVEDPLSLIHI